MKRFFEKVEKRENGCWEWIAGCRKKDSYGTFKFNGKSIDAHRMSFILHFGSIPNKLFVCHSCDNKKCVNPDHLFLGTHSDNMKDAYSKGRLKIPEGGKFKMNHIPSNSTIKSIEIVRDIKTVLLQNSKPLKEVAKEFNVSYQFIRDLNSGRTYKSI